MNRRGKLLAGLDLCSTTGIEIGALTSPIVTPSEGNIIYVDHADLATLRRRYADHASVDVTRIVEVNAVWGANTLQEAIGKDRTVDYVIASHVIEHVPDLLGWLEEIEGVLGPEGTLRLAVPDRRFSFDYLRQEILAFGSSKRADRQSACTTPDPNHRSCDRGGGNGCERGLARCGR